MAQQSYNVVFTSTMAGTSWGGSEELWSGTALHLLERGHRVSASVYDWPQRHSRIENLLHKKAEIQFRPRRPGFAGRMIEKGLCHLRRGTIGHAAASWLEKQSPDLVVISQGYLWDGIPWMQACQELGLAYCPIVHANSEIWWPSDEQLPVITKAYSKAKQIYFVSHANRRLMELQCGMHFEQAKVIINPCNVDSSLPVPWPISADSYDIACVARLDPRAKGQDLLIEVMAEQKWRDRPIRLNFYGSGPYGKSLAAMVGFFGLKNVRFMGQADDVRKIWSENQALVLPSRYEGLPLVIIEAMRCGRLVITTDIAGNAEYIIDDQHGFIADAPTSKSLDAAMERAWERRDEWRKIGASARTHALASLPSNPIEIFSNHLLDLIQGEQPRKLQKPSLLRQLL